MPPARLVRKRPFFERVKAQLNPMDFLLWLSEEIETRDWDSKLVGTQIGIALNFIFLIARANSGKSATVDDVFGDDTETSWPSYLIGQLVYCLVPFGIFNAVYTINRTRKYRLFEADIEKEYDTPSAQRVRVQSPSSMPSPLQTITDMFVSRDTAESRAHPDPTRDVWELAVWDPLPVCLQIFCFFSPGHMLVYSMFLPLAPLDARPSVTVFNCLILQVILSAQLLLLQSRFAQQNKDTAIIQKEVLHEYDTKFVHPRLYPTVRDAATQLSQDINGNDHDFVQIGTPQTLLRRGFRISPNPNYSKHFNPDGAALPQSTTSTRMSPGLFTPPVARQADFYASSVNPRSVAVRRSTPGLPVSRNNTPSHSVATSTNTPLQAQTQGNGGYLGVYNHPNSPLKKTPSLGELQHRTPRNNGEMAQYEQYQAYQSRERSSSPIKSARKSTSALPSASQPAPNPWVNHRQTYERYPSMWR